MNWFKEYWVYLDEPTWYNIVVIAFIMFLVVAAFVWLALTFSNVILPLIGHGVVLLSTVAIYKSIRGFYDYKRRTTKGEDQRP